MLSINMDMLTAEELEELAQAVEVEQGKRKAAESASESSYRGWSVTARTQAPCPSCGRDDAILASKSLYPGPELARGGAKPIGTAVFCKCRTWYNASSGEYADVRNTY